MLYNFTIQDINEIESANLEQLSLESASAVYDFFADEMSLEALLAYPLYYRKFGVRRTSDLSRPPVALFDELKLPKESLLHYFNYVDEETGPRYDDPFLVNHEGRILMTHSMKVNAVVGKPLPNRSTPASALVRQYHRRFRKHRPLVKMQDSARDPKNLLVINHSMLKTLWKYPNTELAKFHEAYNLLDTIFESIDASLDETDRQAFFNFQLPRVIPGPSKLKIASVPVEKMNKEMMKNFDTVEKLFILHFWMFLGAKRTESLFNKIKIKNRERFNIVITDSNRHMTINLETLLLFLGNVVDSGDDEDDYVENPTSDVGNRTMQLRVFAMFAKLIDSRQSNPVTEDLNQGDEASDKEDEGDNAINIITGKKKEPERSGGVDIEEYIEDTDDVVDGKDNPDKPHDDPREILDGEIEELDEDLIEKDLDEIEKRETSKTAVETTAMTVYSNDPYEAFLQKLVERVEKGEITSGQLSRYIRLIEKAREIKCPLAPDMTLLEFINIDPKELKVKPKELPPQPGVEDSTYRTTRVDSFDEDYITNVLDRQIVAACMDIQKAGFIVIGMGSEETIDAVNHYRIIKMKVIDDSGNISVLPIKQPIPQKDGTFLLNGQKARLKKQWRDLPIRKTAHDEVSLTSYYGKLFIERSPRSVFNYQRWLVKNIIAISLDPENDNVRSTKTFNVFDNSVKLPRVYSMLSQVFIEIVLKDCKLFFEHSKANEMLGIPEEANTLKMLLVGKDNDSNPIYIDNSDYFYKRDMKTGATISLGYIEDLVGLPKEKAPLEIAEMSLYNKSIPMGMMLGRRLGLSNLLNMLGETPVFKDAGSKLDLQDDEYTLKFKDVTLIFKKANLRNSMIIHSFNRFHRSIKKFNYASFDNKETFAVIMEENGIGVGSVREIDLIFDTFIDSSTEILLREMNEPTIFHDLLIRATELLTTDQHIDEFDLKGMRIAGYDRFASHTYAEIIRAVRKHRSRTISSNNVLSMNPEAVWLAIATDGSVGKLEERNPFQMLKDREIVTFSGTAGRSKQTMTSKTRRYHRSWLGTMSGATVDSSDVSINSYTAYDAEFLNLLGICGVVEDPNDLTTAQIQTSSSSMFALSDRDDGKRDNFINIQNTHLVGSKEYMVPPCRTGAERYIAQRMPELFCTIASKDGTVSKITNKQIEVTYDDGTKSKLTLGRVFGVYPEGVIPLNKVTTWKVGDKFTPGMGICWVDEFFEEDMLNRGYIIFKMCLMAKIRFVELADTLEDSNMISKRLSKLLSCNITSIKTIRATVTDTIRNLVQVGDKVDNNSIVCTIEDSVSAAVSGDNYSDSNMEFLEDLNRNAPKAGVQGYVEKIEVFYNGSFDDMSDSIKEICLLGDRERAKETGNNKITGKVDATIKVGGKTVYNNTVFIRLFITKDTPAANGDKFVFSNQLKTVSAGVYADDLIAEDGSIVDGSFSYTSVSNRIVGHMEPVGVADTILIEEGMEISSNFLSELGL